VLDANAKAALIAAASTARILSTVLIRRDCA
jgi:hypothetical protein